ncbi:MAG: CDP-alcohol phosphatidyltransferase family protein [Ilumatobacteraceae bacterium]
MSVDKVNAADKFLDLSDYGRPVARRLVRALVDTPITPVQITLSYTVVGFVAAVLFAVGGYANGVVAGILLLVKSTLDAADGSLARARERPSRVGRYLDSICDYAVNAAVFLGLAVNGGLTIRKAVIAVIALESATWQCSAFSYYYVHYRNLTGGDTTSQLDESQTEHYPWDNPRVVRILRRLYSILFGWQDALLGKVDRALTPDPVSPVYRSKRLLTAITVLGLGFQLLLIAVLAWLNRVSWVFALFIVGLNAYWAIFMVVRHRIARRAAVRRT